MPYPVTINGNTYTEADFFGTDGYEFVESFPNIIGDVATVAAEVAGYATGIDTVDVAGTSKTLALSDASTVQECSNASMQTITVPTNAAVAFETDTIIVFEQHGAGQVRIQAASGVTINGVDSNNVDISAQWGSAYIRKIGTNDWVAVGSFS